LGLKSESTRPASASEASDWLEGVPAQRESAAVLDRLGEQRTRRLVEQDSESADTAAKQAELDALLRGAAEALGVIFKELADWVANNYGPLTQQTAGIVEADGLMISHTSVRPQFSSRGFEEDGHVLIAGELRLVLDEERIGGAANTAYIFTSGWYTWQMFEITAYGPPTFPVDPSELPVRSDRLGVSLDDWQREVGEGRGPNLANPEYHKYQVRADDLSIESVSALIAHYLEQEE